MKTDVGKFSDELDALINRWSDEADLSIAEIVGALAYKQFTMMRALDESPDEEEEEED